jgi:uncharacterized protein YdaU (DUF1376 family)
MPAVTMTAIFLLLHLKGKGLKQSRIEKEKLHKIKKESKKEKERRGKAQQKKRERTARKEGENSRKRHIKRRERSYFLSSLSLSLGKRGRPPFFSFERYTGAPGVNAKACRAVER